MDNNVKEENEIDLIELFYVLKSRVFLILLSGFLLAAVVGLISKFTTTPIYSSSTQLYILTKSTSITSLADIQLGEQLTQDYMVLVKSRPVVNKVIDNLNLNMSYDQLASIIAISNPSNTRILEVTANYPDAFIAKKIVDEFAKVSIDRIAQIMDTEKPTIVEEGTIAKFPSNVNTKKNTILGGIIGCCVAAGILIVLYLMDDTLKSEEDIEKYLGLSTLAHIPISTYASKQTGISHKLNKKQKVIA